MLEYNVKNINIVWNKQRTKKREAGKFEIGNKTKHKLFIEKSFIMTK